MPTHQLLRQVKAKSLSVKIPKNEPTTARTVTIPRCLIEIGRPQAALRQQTLRRRENCSRPS